MTTTRLLGDYSTQTPDERVEYLAADIALGLLRGRTPIAVMWVGHGGTIGYEIEDAEQAGLDEDGIDTLRERAGESIEQVSAALYDIWCDQDDLQLDVDAEDAAWKAFVERVSEDLDTTIAWQGGAPARQLLVAACPALQG